VPNARAHLPNARFEKRIARRGLRPSAHAPPRADALQWEGDEHTGVSHAANAAPLIAERAAIVAISGPV